MLFIILWIYIYPCYNFAPSSGQAKWDSFSLALYKTVYNNMSIFKYYKTHCYIMMISVRWINYDPGCKLLKLLWNRVSCHQWTWPLYISYDPSCKLLLLLILYLLLVLVAITAPYRRMKRLLLLLLTAAYYV